MASITLVEPNTPPRRNRTTAWPWRPVRHVIQLAFIALLFALPLLNWFRIDLRGQYMVIFGQTVWMEEFYFLLLATLMFVFFFMAVTLVFGRVWCGWLCPQTPLSEASNWALKHIRRRKGLLRYLLAGIALGVLIVFAAAVGFATMSYIIAPQELWAELTTGNFTPWVWGLLIVTAVIVVLDALFLRHTFCKSACPYGMIQTILTDRDTLRVRFMTERSRDCINCYECSRICPVDLEPRKQKMQLECIDCAECIVACEDVLKPLGKPGIIEFSFGQRSRAQQREFPISAKALAVTAVFVIYSAVFLYLLVNRSPLAVQVVPDPQQRAAVTNEAVTAAYLVEISNRMREPGAYQVQVEGLPAGTYTVTPNTVALAGGQQGHATVAVRVPRGQLAAGSHPFTVHVNSVTQSELTRSQSSSFFVPPGE